MALDHRELRSEPDGIGLIIGASDKSASVRALAVADVVEKIFDLAGFSSWLSEGGLITRQLILQLGGVDNARPFKIPGVRRLLKTYGPNVAFTKKAAVQIIGSRDPENSAVSFKDYSGFYIQPVSRDEKLTPAAVFSYLVERGLFRIGAELNCLNCRLPSWSSLDALKQRIVCELCGREFDATRQLMHEDWRYRRSGVLGKEKNAQGAVPVVITLQQLKLNLGDSFFGGMYSPSLNLVGKPGLELPECEIDFVWLNPRRYPEKTILILGECKDRGSNHKHGKNSGTIDATDIENLRRVADAVPDSRFETYILLSKLCPFTSEEIALARTLNDKYHTRAILLTDRELEPLFSFFERTKLQYEGIDDSLNSAGDLARITDMIYFNENFPGITTRLEFGWTSLVLLESLRPFCFLFFPCAHSAGRVDLVLRRWLGAIRHNLAGEILPPREEVCLDSVGADYDRHPDYCQSEGRGWEDDHRH